MVIRLSHRLHHGVYTMVGAYPKVFTPWHRRSQEWAIHDCKSLNGVTVNGQAIGEEGRTGSHDWRRDAEDISLVMIMCIYIYIFTIYIYIKIHIHIFILYIIS